MTHLVAVSGSSSIECLRTGCTILCIQSIVLPPGRCNLAFRSCVSNHTLTRGSCNVIVTAFKKGKHFSFFFFPQMETITCCVSTWLYKWPRRVNLCGLPGGDAGGGLGGVSRYWGFLKQNKKMHQTPLKSVRSLNLSHWEVLTPFFCMPVFFFLFAMCYSKCMFYLKH